jgi:hypothetical protein
MSIGFARYFEMMSRPLLFFVLLLMPETVLITHCSHTPQNFHCFVFDLCNKRKGYALFSHCFKRTSVKKVFTTLSVRNQFCFYAFCFSSASRRLILWPSWLHSCRDVCASETLRGLEWKFFTIFKGQTAQKEEFFWFLKAIYFLFLIVE